MKRGVIMNESKPEKEYISDTEPKYRKKFGQVFTPVYISKFMTRWVTDKLAQNSIILDPALGLGTFFRCLPTPNAFQLEGYELDSNLAQRTDSLFSSLSIDLNCKNQDFLMAEIDKKYDGIICNPPYIHFQDYNNSLSLIERFNQEYGLDLKGFSNIYSLFLIKALQLLKSKGRAAFIIPSEFLNADYGVTIKKYLLNHRSLKHLIIFDPSYTIFEGILTTSAILLFDNKKSDKLNFYNIKEAEQLHTLENELYNSNKNDNSISKQYPLEKLDPEVKWKYYYKNLKINLHLNSKSHLIPFKELARIRRGIATGANDFFTLSQTDLDKFNIDSRYIDPCLTRASQVKGAIFSQEELDNLMKNDRRIFLLSINKQKLDQSIIEYIKYGEQKGYNQRYLSRNRNPWYSLKITRPADLLVKTFGRKKAVFIQNKTQALNLTCFHSIYLNSKGRKFSNIIFLYLLTDLAREIFEGQKRDYSSGLGKFEPNDIKETYLLDFNLFKEKDIHLLKQLYLDYLSKDNKDTIITEAEDIFKKYW